MNKLKIAFIVIGNSRRSGYLDGDTLRNGGSGGSGTDTSSILMAEYLASQGHEVVLASEKLEPMLEMIYAEQGKHFDSGKKVRGVQYTNLDFEGSDSKEFDILCTSLWFKDYDKLPIKVSKALLYWNHMQWVYSIDEMISFCEENNLKLGFVDISEWQRGMTQDIVDGVKKRYDKVYQTLIPNPILDEIIKEVVATNPQKKKHKFIFHAGWARGGDVAVQAVRELGFEDAEFHSFDYLMATHAHQDEFFHMHNGVDKKTLFTHLAESDYFIYPLYTPYKNVHSDTFSCVVAEAIALGVTVITYSIAALPENYSGFVYWLPFPEGVTDEEVNGVTLYQDPEGKFNTTDSIVSAVKYLEENTDERNLLADSGQDIMLKNFSVDVVGKQWVNFLNELI